MRTTILAAAVLLLAASSPAEAGIRQAGGTGVGLGSGTFANGLSLKHFLTDMTAVQVNAGTWGTYRHFGGGLAGCLDFLLEMPPLHKGQGFHVGWSLGAGGGFGLVADELVAAAAGVAGVEMNVTAIPIDVVLEYRPGLGIIPVVGFEVINFTGHVRYYFR